MRHISLLVLLIVFTPFAAAQSARDGKTLVITQVTVIDVANAALKPDMTVTVRGGRITGMEKASRKLP